MGIDVLNSQAYLLSCNSFLRMQDMKFCYLFSIPALIVTLLLLNGCNQERVSNNDSKQDTISMDTARQKRPVAATDKNLLIGNWVRTDASYQISISALLENGDMNARYFNPKSIHVATAAWADVDGILQVYLELRDQGYPGSNYKLSYLPDRDVLSGEYFQAVQGATYPVEFGRSK